MLIENTNKMEQYFTAIAEASRPIIREELQRIMGELKTSFTPPQKETNYLSRKQTAERLNLSIMTLGRMTQNGTITAHRVGARILFKPCDVEACLTKIKIGA